MIIRENGGTGLSSHYIENDWITETWIFRLSLIFCPCQLAPMQWSS